MEVVFGLSIEWWVGDEGMGEEGKGKGRENVG